jgi:hypothetical protein
MDPIRWLQILTLTASLAVSAAGRATGSPSDLLPATTLLAGGAGSGPVENAAFVPGDGAATAPAFAGRLRIRQSQLETLPAIVQPVIGGRDARLFPGVTLDFYTQGKVLVPRDRGTMVRETAPGATPSYWRVIPQFGRVWHEAADGEWSRAAFPLMLVNDTENHAHQGLATFLYRGREVSALRLQFVQQTGPYLVKPHFVAWGAAAIEAGALDPAEADTDGAKARDELAARLPAVPMANLLAALPAGTLAGFGGPLRPKWQVATALVRDGTLYYQASPTPYGDYPYPLEMRFGVRSITKSVVAPLALLRLAQVYGPWVLTLRIGDYVPGLDPKWQRIRFRDAADMATGFGGLGSTRTQPNDPYDGYLEGDYDAWYTAPSRADKLAQIRQHLRPYPWEPGVVMRYRDQDFFLLGAAIDGFLKTERGPQADLWDFVQSEVLQPIGIAHAPSVRTREPDGRDGLVWANAGYYPTLDDLAKIALLYRDHGEHAGRQILNRKLTKEILEATDALRKTGDASLGGRGPSGEPIELYHLGFHYTPYVGSASHRLHYLPTMSGSGENEVVIYPNQLISIRTAKASQLPEGETASTDDGPTTARAVDRLLPF